MSDFQQYSNELLFVLGVFLETYFLTAEPPTPPIILISKKYIVSKPYGVQSLRSFCKFAYPNLRVFYISFISYMLDKEFLENFHVYCRNKKFYALIA